jgi:hypothetical protein
MYYCFDTVNFDFACYDGENLILADTHVVQEVVAVYVQAVVEEGAVETFVEQRVKLLNISNLIGLEKKLALNIRRLAS